MPCCTKRYSPTGLEVAPAQAINERGAVSYPASAAVGVEEVLVGITVQAVAAVPYQLGGVTANTGRSLTAALAAKGRLGVVLRALSCHTKSATNLHVILIKGGGQLP